MKFGRAVVHDTRRLPTKFRVPPSLRLPAPFLGKNPREPRRLRPMGPAALDEKDR